MTTTEKPCRQCDVPIPIASSVCPECGAKRASIGWTSAVASLFVLVLVAMGLWRMVPGSGPSELDVEAMQQFQVAEELDLKIKGMGLDRPLPALGSERSGYFQDVNLICGRLAKPNGKYDRVIIANGEAMEDSPMQGRWFDHVWRQAGCD